MLLLRRQVRSPQPLPHGRDRVPHNLQPNCELDCCHPSFTILIEATPHPDQPPDAA
ncbi:MAG TPA: hypothetical protein V6C57_08905 [Coleofasciculaceae cyanobacterium]